MSLAPGTALGAYEIVAQLGAGGMGEVYRARDSRLERDVALKVLRGDVARDPARLERFGREARAIAALNHPHIVTIHSTEEADGLRFLTMELIEGQTLDGVLVPGGLAVARFLELALPLADALAAAHQKHITHRDLKPGNVMVSADGRVKVLDFGLARMGEAGGDHAIDATRAVLTGEGTIVGTMPYMSPEQVEGRPLDPRSDLFSLGVMFYEMLTGARPFRAASSPALMSAILRDTPPLVTSERADVPEALARLVARCLEKRPDDRVQTARDVYNELRHLQRQLEAGVAPARSSSGSGRHASTEPRIAVLPFGHRGADAAAGLADGLTEDVTTGLSRFAHLRVVPAATAATLTPDAAQRAGVRYLLEGRVQGGGGGGAVRVTVRLIDGATGSNLWAQTFDRTLGTGAFDVQDDIASHVVATVGDTSGVLARSIAATLLRRPVEDLTVRELVLRFHAYVEHFQAEEHARLRGGLERALEQEPLVAEGWACLADLYEHEHSQRLNPLPDSLGRQRRAAQRAVEIDPHNQRGWTAMAAVHTFERDRAALRIAAERAVGLNPLDADTVGLCALFLSCAGDDDRAMSLFERAVQLKPQHPGWYHFTPFTTHYKRQQYAEALAQAKRIALHQLPTSHMAAAAAAARVGSVGEAHTALEGLRRLDARLLEREAARQAWALWLWDEAVVEDLVDGLARALDMQPVPARAQHARPAEPQRSGSTAPRTSRPAVHEMRVAVLPFTARGNADAIALAEGLTDELTTALARFAYLQVVTRAAPPGTAAQSPRASTAGAAPDARFLLEGSLHQIGSSVRVSLRLSDRETGAHLWADTLDRDLSAGLFAVQDDIVSRLAATVADAGGVLVRSMGAAVRDLPLEELELDDLLLRFQLYSDQFTAADHAGLTAAFEALVVREPGAAKAWACLAILVATEMFFDLNPRPQPLARLRECAERATVLDSSIQLGWTAMAVLAIFDRDRNALEAAAERAIALNPLHTRTLAVVGLQLVFSGETDRGVALLERAMVLNPRHPGWYLIGPFLQAYERRDFDLALRTARRIGMPQFLPGLLAAASAAGKTGAAAEVRSAIEAIARACPGPLDPALSRRHWQACLWDTAAIERLVDGFAKALFIAAATPPPESSAAERAQSPWGETPT
ncbi:MAG: protein kinase [Vicinamibacterales bacterium]